MNVEYQSPDGRRRSELTATAVHQSFRDAEEQRVAVVQATGDERLDQCFTRISILQTMTGQPAVAGAAGSRLFDRP